MKKIIVYYPFPLKDGSSGSGVRPIKLLEAFSEFARRSNLECIEIFGTSKERKEKLKRLYQMVNPKDILFCYMENQTIPIWLSDPSHIPMRPLLDYQFMRYLKKNHIPLGIFYRDIYWKFTDMYKVKNKLVTKIMISLFHYEFKMFEHFAKKIFLPSIEMNKYLKLSQDKVDISPPGGVDKVNMLKLNHDQNVTAIYVGGIHPRYGIYEVLEALSNLNESKTLIELILVCRKNELQENLYLMTPFLKRPWLKIHHEHGEKLDALYGKADFGIVTLQKNVYNDFAVPVKLFEYMSYGLPVVSSNCTALQSIVKKDKIGYVTEDNVTSIEQGLMEIMNDKMRELYRENVIHVLHSKHLWLKRVESIYHSLVEPADDYNRNKEK
ncbi:glycosyltransferase [Bacillus sp. FJAT-50079]|uniref:glycosyltransferase n=1 Tax=Bacillus sp. FJAT-50079 TaxID=2833577 RepID=UPI001BC9BD24|nr:glycosyltransferase [Bacillus sp. FJAT-50079]MBS4206755.1 glycosyltransferase [Bacillus sp. FJAT-50079]